MLSSTTSAASARSEWSTVAEPVATAAIAPARWMSVSWPSGLVRRREFDEPCPDIGAVHADRELANEQVRQLLDGSPLQLGGQDL